MATVLASRARRLTPALWQVGTQEGLRRARVPQKKLRLKALEAKVAQDGILLTEAQIAALEKAKADKEAHGEFESECPGYCGAQDTFYVGTLKGVGRIYQQTVIDTYAKVAFAKLYDRKTPITAAEILNATDVSDKQFLCSAEASRFSVPACHFGWRRAQGWSRLAGGHRRRRLGPRTTKDLVEERLFALRNTTCSAN